MTPEEFFPKITQKIATNPKALIMQAQISNFWSHNLGFIKALAILLTAFFVGSAIFFLIKTGWIQLRVDRIRDVILRSNMPKKRSVRAWREVQKHFFAGTDGELKAAIIEADNMMDEVLRTAGFRGQTLGDRLKQITSAQLENIDQIWEAHKLRNRIAHETDFKMNRDLAERALAIYQKTFKDLELLD